MASTFHKYGGFSTVSKVVMDFYETVLDNDVVGHHFDDVDMARLMDHQTKFISSLMGGPIAMSDDQLERVHRNLDITVAEYNEIISLLTAALSRHGVEKVDVDEIAQAFDSKRHLILSAEK